MSAISDSQKWLILAAILLGGWLIATLSPILSPFLAGLGIAYLGAPLVDYIERNDRSRTLAVTLVFTLFVLLFILLVLILLPILEQQSVALMHKIPLWLEWVREHVLPGLAESLGMDQSDTPYTVLLQGALLQHWQQAGGLLAALVAYISSSSLGVAAWLTNMLLIPVVAFYLLIDWKILLEHLSALIPRRYEQTIIGLFRECDEMLASFLRGQLLVMSALAGIYVVGLWLIGLEFALLIGLLAGVVSFVPYLGFIIGILVAGVAAFMQFHDIFHIVLVFGVFGIGQLLESFWLTPTLVGDKIGLHPVAVIFAIMAGGQLLGFIGVLIGLPAAAVIMVWLRHARQNYLDSELYRDEDAEPPPRN